MLAENQNEPTSTILGSGKRQANPKMQTQSIEAEFDLS